LPILDRVLETGEAVQVVRWGGRIVKLVAGGNPSRPRSRKKHVRAMIGDPEDFVHIEWLQEWSEAKR